jgi:hypothetical protein
LTAAGCFWYRFEISYTFFIPRNVCFFTQQIMTIKGQIPKNGMSTEQRKCYLTRFWLFHLVRSIKYGIRKTNDNENYQTYNSQPSDSLCLSVQDTWELKQRHRSSKTGSIGTEHAKLHQQKYATEQYPSKSFCFQQRVQL